MKQHIKEGVNIEGVILESSEISGIQIALNNYAELQDDHKKLIDDKFSIITKRETFSGTTYFYGDKEELDGFIDGVVSEKNDYEKRVRDYNLLPWYKKLFKFEV